MTTITNDDDDDDDDDNDYNNNDDDVNHDHDISLAVYLVFILYLQDVQTFKLIKQLIRVGRSDLWETIKCRRKEVDICLGEV